MQSVFSPNTGNYGPQKKQEFGHFSAVLKVESLLVFPQLSTEANFMLPEKLQKLR